MSHSLADRFARSQQEIVEDRVTALLIALDVDLADPNFMETPRRVATHLIDVFTPLDDIEIDQMKLAVFPKLYDGMVATCGIEAFGTCPHHLQHISYLIHIAYIPSEFVIGLSKLPRLAIQVAKMPILQEDVGPKLCDLLEDLLGTKSVAVVVEGQHSCIGVRGVKQPNITVTTAEMRGVFAENAQDAKGEFMRYIQRSTR